MGEGLSSISLPIERSPPLSNSLHTIYLFLYYVFICYINFLYHSINFDVYCYSYLLYLFKNLNGEKNENVTPALLGDFQLSASSLVSNDLMKVANYFNIRILLNLFAKYKLLLCKRLDLKVECLDSAA